MSGGSSRAKHGVCKGVSDALIGEVRDSLRVVTINTRGTGVGHGEYYKINALVDFAEEEGFDIVGVTELHVIRRQERNILERDCSYQGYWATRASDDQSRNDGVVMLVRKAWAKYAQAVKRWEGCLVAVDFAFPGGLWLRVVVVYAPSTSGSDAGVAKILRGWLEEANGKGMVLLVCGDFNDVVDHQLDRVPSRPQAHRIGAVLTACFSKGLSDSFRLLHPELRGLDCLTWIDPFDEEHGSRIDYIFVDERLAMHLTGGGIVGVEEVASDHRAVWAEMHMGMLTKAVQASVIRKELRSRRIWDVRGAGEQDWQTFTSTCETELQKAGSHDVRGSDALWGALAAAVLCAASRSIQRKSIRGHHETEIKPC